MTVSIMQPYLFPYLGYFQLINQTDEFIFLDDVNFINKGWINRNRLLSNGQPLYFTVPLSGASQNKLINEIEISYQGKWQVKMLKNFEMNYSKSPFYREVYPLLESVFLSGTKKISDLDILSIKKVMGYLGIEKKIYLSSDLDTAKETYGADRIIQLAKIQKADRYVNPEGGQKLYDQDQFRENTIELDFIQMIPASYPQRKVNEFIPYLSIIDVLMNVSPEEVYTKYLNDFRYIRG